MTKQSLSERLFDGGTAECELEELLDSAGVLYENLGWDHYDNSLELHGVPENYRLSIEGQKVIWEAGFSKVYMNHINKWETHYSFRQADHSNGPFEESKGWRVSYPYKRGEENGAILVEKEVAGWPPEWFGTGYAKVVEEPKCLPLPIAPSEPQESQRNLNTSDLGSPIIQSKMLWSSAWKVLSGIFR